MWCKMIKFILIMNPLLILIHAISCCYCWIIYRVVWTHIWYLVVVVVYHHAVYLPRPPIIECELCCPFLKLENILHFNVWKETVIIRLVMLLMMIDSGILIVRNCLHWGNNVERPWSVETVPSQFPSAQVSCQSKYPLRKIKNRLCFAFVMVFITISIRLRQITVPHLRRMVTTSHWYIFH